METKFEKFNLLVKEHDDISGTDNVLVTIKRAILVARAPKPLRTHLQLNSQSYTSFLKMRQAINQYLKARKSSELVERDDPMDVDFVHKEGQKGKGKGNDKGKGKPQSKSKGKGKQNEKGKSSGKGKSNQENASVPAGTVARQDTSGANVGRKAVEPRNRRTMSVRRRKLVT